MSSGSVRVIAGSQGVIGPVQLERWAELARLALVSEGVEGPAELNLTFVSEDRIAEMNTRFMGESGPTDVLAFPLDVDSDDEAFAGLDVPRMLGDVVICPSVAGQNASRHSGDLDDELALLTVHGVLHILGMDHADPAEAAVMKSRERQLLARFHQS